MGWREEAVGEVGAGEPGAGGVGCGPRPGRWPGDPTPAGHDAPLLLLLPLLLLRAPACTPYPTPSAPPAASVLRPLLLSPLLLLLLPLPVQHVRRPWPCSSPGPCPQPASLHSACPPAARCTASGFQSMSSRTEGVARISASYSSTLRAPYRTSREHSAVAPHSASACSRPWGDTTTRWRHPPAAGTEALRWLLLLPLMLLVVVVVVAVLRVLLFVQAPAAWWRPCGFVPEWSAAVSFERHTDVRDGRACTRARAHRQAVSPCERMSTCCAAGCWRGLACVLGAPVYVGLVPAGGCVGRGGPAPSCPKTRRPLSVRVVTRC